MTEKGKNRHSGLEVVGGGWRAVGIGMRAASQLKVQAALQSPLLFWTSEQLLAMLMPPGCLPKSAVSPRMKSCFSRTSLLLEKLWKD